MPKLKRLLPSATFETAQRLRQCSRNRGHKIIKGDKCLVIKENMKKRNYCLECACLILEKAKKDLDALIDSVEFELPDSPSQ